MTAMKAGWLVGNPKGGLGGRGVFCSAQHPTREEVWCRRLPHEDGEHSAFVHSISEPEHWQMEPPF